MILADRISKKYNEFLAVDRVSLKIRAGRNIGFTWPKWSWENNDDPHAGFGIASNLRNSFNPWL